MQIKWAPAGLVSGIGVSPALLGQDACAVAVWERTHEHRLRGSVISRAGHHIRPCRDSVN